LFYYYQLIIVTRTVQLVPCTAVLVGLWPVSDEVFPLASVQEQC